MTDKEEGIEDNELKKLISNKKDKSYALPIQQSLASITEYWKGVDLEGKRSVLDSQAAEIADAKDSRLVNRKKLAEQTKSFRKLAEQEKLQAIGPLLKLYQEEIDTLTKRSKFSDSAFLGVYKFLAEAPDPVLGLLTAQNDTHQNSVTKIAELELENKKYKTELEEFRKDFGEIKNQEVTIRRLEDKISSYESKIESIVEERIKVSEELLKSETSKTIDNFREKESEMQRQLTHALNELNRSQQALEVSQSQLLELKAKYDEVQVAKQSEYDMLVDELETAKSRVLLLEREREKSLQNNGQITSSTSSTVSRLTSTDLELELAQKEIEYSHLKENFSRIEHQSSTEISTLKSEISSLQHQLSNERSRVKTLENQLSNNPTSHDYQEIKNQLDVLKRTFEYSDSDSTSVEKLLKEKNKKLETEIVQLKALMNEKNTSIAELTEKTISLEKSEIEMKKLISKLEEDISKGYSNKQEEDILTSVPPSPIRSKSSSSSSISLNSGEDNNSMLQIVINQRDRFKQRIIELEAQNKELHQQIDYKNGDINSLRNDNIKLYEKIKYLQSYGNTYNSNSRRDLESNKKEEDEVDSRYSKLYEDTVNPFVIFNRKEKYRRYKELNPAEKVILNSSTFFLSSKGTRLFLFFYSLSLHILVFATLYKLAHSSPTACT